MSANTKKAEQRKRYRANKAKRNREILLRDGVECGYCGNRADLITGAEKCPHRPDLAEIQLWECKPCDAYVGCHQGTINPKGSLANSEDRSARMKAHAAFDPIWKTGQMPRNLAYKWLTEELGIDWNDCHIGMFDKQQCAHVVRACRNRELEIEG